MKKGWISLHRELQDCSIWTDEEPFDRRSAWVDLIMLANHKDKEIIFNGAPMIIKRGQYLTSIRKLSERWHWSVNRTVRYTDLLEKLNMIRKDSNNRRTLLTIVKYDVFQSVRNTDEYTDEYTGEYTGELQTIKKNNVNNVNKYARTRKPSVNDFKQGGLSDDVIEEFENLCLQDVNKNVIEFKREVNEC